MRAELRRRRKKKTNGGRKCAKEKEREKGEQMNKAAGECESGAARAKGRGLQRYLEREKKQCNDDT